MEQIVKIQTDGPEIVIALVGAVGTGLEIVSTAIRDSLAEVNYISHHIRLSELLHEIEKWKNLPDMPVDTRYNQHMDAGNEFRQILSRGDALR